MAIYNFLESLKRIDEIKEADGSSNHLPYAPTSVEFAGEQALTVDATVVYIRIKVEAINGEQSTLKRYKPLFAFMSETARIVMSNSNCRDISYMQDSIQIIYSTPKKADVDSVIDDAARIRTLSLIISKKFRYTNDVKLTANMGIDYGQLLMMPLPQQKEAKSFSWYGLPMKNAKAFTEKNSSDNILISETIWNNLKQENQRLFKQNGLFEDYYEGNIINVVMNNWLVSNE